MLEWIKRLFTYGEPPEYRVIDPDNGKSATFDHFPTQEEIITFKWGGPSTAEQAATILQEASRTLLERDQEYKGSDRTYAKAMKVLFPDGVELNSARDQHRFHLLMLIMVKVTRYVRNWEGGGHPDSLIDLAAYAGMLAAVDKKGSPLPPGPSPLC